MRLDPEARDLLQASGDRLRGPCRVVGGEDDREAGVSYRFESVSGPRDGLRSDVDAAVEIEDDIARGTIPR